MPGWSTQEVLTVVAVIGNMATAGIGLAAVKAVRTVHVMMNSRLTELLSASKGEARAEGVAQERAETEAKVAAKSDGT